MEIAGYLASILIGISLGLIGGGGSILTVPVLVYLFHIEPVVATVYSLFVVGATSLVGSGSYFSKGLVNLKTALVFGLPSIAVVFLTRKYIVPSIPGNIFQFENFTLTKDIFLMLLFAMLMVVASYSMIKKNKSNALHTASQTFNYPLVLLQGAVVGLLTGLVGAGGGFLIIPTLVNLLKMPIKTAIGTSLFIIALNALMGFVFSIQSVQINWTVLIIVSAIAIVGIVLGSKLSHQIDGKKLKPAFGWFVFIMGVYIILKETLL